MKEEDFSKIYTDQNSPFSLYFPDEKNRGPFSIFRGRVDQTWMLLVFPQWAKSVTFRNEPGGELYIALLNTGITPGMIRTPDQNFLRVYDSENITLPLTAGHGLVETVRHNCLLVASNSTITDLGLLGHSFVAIANKKECI